MPILIQQSIDKGYVDGEVQIDVIVRLAVIAAVVIVVARLRQPGRPWPAWPRRSEHALYGLRTRAFAHIHQLSIADHAEERRGALVARVTCDVETLSQFFSWGGIAWLLDGTLMVAVAITMFVYSPAARAGGRRRGVAAVPRAARAAEAARGGLRQGAPAQRRDAHAPSPRS